MKTSRRQFIFGSAVLATAGAAGWRMPHWLGAAPDGVLLSAFEDLPGNQYVGGLILPAGRVFGRRIPVRAHGSAVAPHTPQRVLYFARRPGTDAFSLDLQTLEVRKVFTTPAGRHLAGHGLFSPDGAVLYTPEHDYETPRGVIGIRDAHDFRILGEIETQGIDPHEIAWLPDGRTLVVANGGILTHPKSFRRKLNIPTMDPSLCFIDAASGRCLEQMRLPDHRLSIRHLAVTTSGTVVAGLQYEGDARHAPSVAVVYRPGTGLKLLELPEQARYQVNGYVASVAASDASGEIAATCPMGTCLARWSLESGEFLSCDKMHEVYGVTYAREGRLFASQRDGTAVQLKNGTTGELALHASRPIRWDDHWTLAPQTVRDGLPRESDIA